MNFLTTNTIRGFLSSWAEQKIRKDVLLISLYTTKYLLGTRKKFSIPGNGTHPERWSVGSSRKFYLFGWLRWRSRPSVVNILKSLPFFTFYFLTVEPLSTYQLQLAHLAGARAEHGKIAPLNRLAYKWGRILYILYDLPFERWMMNGQVDKQWRINGKDKMT